ncbi:MAG: hypothetical protein L6R43_12990 [Planctomycetes bacterium]|nr:hypothetical protein [Planctomycetota bacterium]
MNVHKLYALVEAGLTDAERRRVLMQMATPACHPAVERQFRERILAERGYDPVLHDVPLPPPRRDELPAGDLDGPLLVRPAGDVPLRIPAAALSPVSGIVGVQGMGKSVFLGWLVRQLVEADCTVVAAEPLGDGLTRLAARLGPARATVLRLQDIPVSFLEPEFGELPEMALARVVEAYRALYAGSGTESVFRQAFESTTRARQMSGEDAGVALEDLRHLIRNAPRKRFGQAASYLDSAQRVIETPATELRTAYRTRRGIPVCELLRPGLLVIDGTGVSDGALAFFARAWDGKVAAHLVGCPLHQPPRPGFGRVYTVLDEAHIHLKSTPATKAGPAVEDWWSKQLRESRHRGQVLLLADQAMEGWGPGLIAGLGLFLALRTQDARTRSVVGGLLSLPLDARDRLVGMAPPREGVLNLRGLLPPCHVRVPLLSPLGGDGLAVAMASATRLAAWREGCVFWEPPEEAWKKAAAQFRKARPATARVAEPGATAAPEEVRSDDGAVAAVDAPPQQPVPSGEALEAMAPELRVKVLGLLRRCAERLELYPERAAGMRIPLDEESALRDAAWRLGLVRVAGTVGNKREVAVPTEEGYRVLAAAGVTKVATWGKEGPCHALLRERCESLLRAGGWRVRAGGALPCAGGRVEPDLIAESVDGDGVVTTFCLQVELGNVEREANAIARLAALQEVAGVVVVSGTARLAKAIEPSIRRALEPSLRARVRVIDANAVLDGESPLPPAKGQS